MLYEIKDKFTNEILKSLKDSVLGYNYYNIRVKYADTAKEVNKAKIADRAICADNITDKIIDGGNSKTIY